MPNVALAASHYIPNIPDNYAPKGPTNFDVIHTNSAKKLVDGLSVPLQSFKSNLFARMFSSNVGNDLVEKFTTEFSREAFKNIQDNTLGTSHIAKKYTVGLIAGLTPPALIVGTAATAAYYIIGGMDWYTSAKLVVGIGCMDMGAKATGINPKKMISYLALAGLTFIAKMCSDAAMHPYNLKELKAAKKIEVLHQNIINEEKQSYDHAASELVRQYNESVNNPRKMVELQATAKTITSNLNTIQNVFSNKLGLVSSEHSQILNMLKKSIALINSFNLKIKTPKTKEDSEYNAKLLLALPMSACGEAGISDELRINLKEGSKPQLGKLHTIKSALKAASMGITTTAVASTSLSLIFALGSYLSHAPTYEAVIGGPMNYWQTGADVTSWAYPALAASVVGTISLVAGSYLAKHSWKNSQQERRETNSAIEHSIQLANTNVAKIFDGIESYMKSTKLPFSEMDDLQDKLNCVMHKISRWQVIDSKYINNHFQKQSF